MRQSGVLHPRLWVRVYLIQSHLIQGHLIQGHLIQGLLGLA